MFNLKDDTFKCQVGLEIIVDNTSKSLVNNLLEPCAEETFQMAAVLEEFDPNSGKIQRPTAVVCKHCQFSNVFPSGVPERDYVICTRCTKTYAIRNAALGSTNFKKPGKIGKGYTVSRRMPRNIIDEHGSLTINDYYFLFEAAGDILTDSTNEPAMKITTPRRRVEDEVKGHLPELRELINHLGDIALPISISSSCTSSVSISFDRSPLRQAQDLCTVKKLITLAAILERDFLIPISGPHHRGMDCASILTGSNFMKADGTPHRPSDAPGAWITMRQRASMGIPLTRAGFPENAFLGFPQTQPPDFFKTYLRDANYNHTAWDNPLNIFIRMVWSARDQVELKYGMQGSAGRMSAIMYHLDFPELLGTNAMPQESLEFRYQSGTLDAGHIHLWVELLGQMVKFVSRPAAEQSFYMQHLYNVLPKGGYRQGGTVNDLPLKAILSAFEMQNRGDEWLRRINELRSRQPRPLGPDGKLKRGAGDS